jgi:hypothetical protein
MRLSRLLSKHSADAANIQKSNSVNHFNRCATIWKVRIFEGTPAIRLVFGPIRSVLWLMKPLILLVDICPTLSSVHGHCHLELQASSQTACDITRKAKRQNLFTFSESIKYDVLIILTED